ncbi:zinc ribbon-containing (seleno)protein DG [Desulforhopalus singaporensis]|uniref:zinc ribbon-containing (seleno)protein DG n=1 Tax=Desulforhopalus singaporensis TaxID=91360 RepID=UPI00115F9CA0|nr:hypothetical protein [Desulforhopalus singaporensis]
MKFFKKKNKTAVVKERGRAIAGSLDPAMNYCPSCECEFRAEIFRCPSCDVELVKGSEKIAEQRRVLHENGARTMAIGPLDELVNIKKGGLRDVKELRAVLAKNRIPAVIAADESGCAKRCCGPEMLLQVKKDDLAAANRVLTENFVKTTALDLQDLEHAAAIFDPGAEETVCPACGCRFPPAAGSCPECGLCFE